MTGGVYPELSVAGCSRGWLTLGTPDGWSITFQPAPNLVPPQWPGQEHPQQLHLDLWVQDLDAAEVTALKLGATRLPGGGKSFRVFADPAAHPFCLIG